MAEELRNETSIVLGGQPRTMKATFAAIRSIERETGKSIIQLIAGAADLSMTDVVTVIHHGLYGNGDTRLKTVEQTGEAVMEAGFSNAALAVVEFLGQALNGASLGKPEAVAKAPQ